MVSGAFGPAGPVGGRLNRSDAYLAALSRQLPTVTVDCDGEVVSVGAAAQVAFDLDPSRVTGRPFDEIFPVTSDPELRCVGGFEDAAVARRLKAVPLEGAPDEPIVYVLQDVTDLLRARAECMNLTRLAAAGRLISSIVHEINNPLSGIIGYSQLLLMRELDREVRSEIEKIYGESLRTSRIVRNLLDFARRRSTKAAGRVVLGKVLRKALELKSHDLRVKNVSVHLDVADSLPPVNGDMHQLMQVFVNLVGNSEQAMYSSDRGGRISFEASSAGGTVSLVMRDTGPGIPEPLRERVFEPFFTTKDEGQGTGLGLALCREILRKQGASIQLLEPDGEGAAFLLTFKIVPAHAAATVRVPRRRTARVKGRRVVVVEDDPVCRSLVTEAFERSGNVVNAFDRSDAALKHLTNHIADVIISDLHRPGLNGIEFHDRLAKVDPALARRIVFLTGDTLNDDFARFLREHGNPYVPKPVELATLFEKVQDLLEASTARQRTLFGSRADPGGAREEGAS